MQFIKGSIAMLAVTSIFAATSAQAGVLTNWYVDTDGAGGSAAKALVKDYLDLTGVSYVKNSFTSPSSFNFNEFGTFNILTADGGAPIGTNFNPALTSTFSSSGVGTVGSPGGTLTFNTGVLNLFSGVNNIATFTLTTGSANLVANSVLPNGTVSIIFKATSLASGYFFDSSLTDLSTLLSPTSPLVFGFATTNVIALSGLIPSSLVTGYNNAFSPDTAGAAANGTTNLLLSNNGQYRVSVPEPGSLALLGIGILALGLSARRKQA